VTFTEAETAGQRRIRLSVALLMLAAFATSGCEIVGGIKRRPLAEGGSGGSAAGMTAGTGGSAGTGGGAGTGGSIGGTGGRQTRIGTSCPTLGDLDCDGQMVRQTLVCGTGYLWNASSNCPLGQLCDSSPGDTHGTCLPVLPECAGHAAQDPVCIGGERRACGPDLVNSTLIEPCQNPTGECARCKPVALASSQTGARNVVIDGTNAYWAISTLGGPVFRTPLDGSGSATMVGSLGGRGGLTPIALDAGHVYGFGYLSITGAGGATLQSMPVALPVEGGDAVPLDTSGTNYENSLGILTAGGGNVYWAPTTTYMGGAVLKVPATGGASMLLASNQGSIQAITSNANSVYWTTASGAVTKVDQNGEGMTILASGQQTPRGIAVAENDVYWTNGGGTVMTIPVGGGSTAMLASGPGSGGSIGIAVDVKTVYWADATAGKIMRIARTGGIPVTVAAASSPGGLAVDETHLYWANSGDNTIMKIAK